MHPLTIQSSHALRAMAVTAAMLAAYASFSLGERIGRTDGFWARRGWLTAAAAVLGLGMWSMHFFGALEDPLPSEVVYQLRIVVLCLLVAVSCSWAGLRILVWGAESRVRLLWGAALLSGGLLGMHFLGEHALRSASVTVVHPWWVLVAMVLSSALFLLAVRMAFGEASDPVQAEWRRVGGSALMGATIALTHVVALRALVLTPVSGFVRAPGTVRGSWVGETALLVTLGLVLLVTLGTAAIDKRRFRELSALHGALAASQQALLRSRNDLREANALLSELSIRDGLTGLYNRRKFDEVFETEWKRSLRSMRPLALLMIDVDCFKALNDSYGHQHGDECLREIARILEEQPRRGHDMVARFGGEEFAVLLPGSDAAGAMRVAESIRHSVMEQRLEHPSPASAAAPWVTVSVGVCSRMPQPGQSSDSMLYQADMALYLAKQLGRNRVELREATPVQTAGAGGS